MSNKPAEELQAEALDLSLEERARLAYRLLESLDKTVEADKPADAEQGEHTSEAAPAEPKPHAKPLPQYRVRFDDDGDVAIPVRFTVRDDPKREKTTGGKVFGQAAAAPVIPAEQVDPFPATKPPAGSVASGTLDSDSALGVPDAQAVAALLQRLSPESRPTVQQHAPAAPPSAARIPNLAPDPFAPTPPVRLEDAAQDPFVDWEAGIEVDKGNQSDTHAALVGLGTTLPVRRRTGIVVTSVVGGVGAMAALGVVVLQGRNPSPDDFRNAVTAAAPAAPALAAPSQETSSVPAAAVASNSEPSATATREPDAPPPTENSAETYAPTTLRPDIKVPAIPTLGALAVTETTIAPARIGAPTVAVPNARAYDASSQPLQIPQVRNAVRVQQALEREYPIGLRAVGVGGRVQISFYVNDQGTVERFQIEESSGNAALDQAALRVAPAFEFTPAQRGSERVAGWFSRAITFGTGANVAADAAVQPSAGATADPNLPVTTRFDLAPQVRNAPRVRLELERSYPVNLRDSGVGGRAEVWFHISEEGTVERFLLKKTSGNTALDQAALKVAKVFEFNPGQVDGQHVAGWFSVAIAFDPRTGSGGIR